MHAKPASLLLVVAILIGTPIPAQADNSTGRHHTGIEIVGLKSLQARPANEVEAAAFDEAYRHALAHRTEMGYPWLDEASRRVQYSWVTPSGKVMAEQALASAKLGTAPLLRQAQRSIEDLDRISFEVTAIRGSGIEGHDDPQLTG